MDGNRPAELGLEPRYVWDEGRNCRVAAVCDATVADLVGLVGELVALLEVYAPDIEPGRLYLAHPPGSGVVFRELPGGWGLVDLAGELSREGLAVLAEVLAVEADDLDGPPGTDPVPPPVDAGSSGPEAGAGFCDPVDADVCPACVAGRCHVCGAVENVEATVYDTPVGGFRLGVCDRCFPTLRPRGWAHAVCLVATHPAPPVEDPAGVGVGVVG